MNKKITQNFQNESLFLKLREIKENRANADFWTPVAYFYGINRIGFRWSSLNPEL